MPNNAPITRPHKGDGPLSERIAKGVINARRDDRKLRILKNRVERSERSAKRGGVAVAIGVAFEVALALANSEPLLLKIAIGLANGLVALGVAAEVLFGRRAAIAQAELQRRAESDLAESIKLAAEANERAAKADLARIELENKLAPRYLEKWQTDALQQLGGIVETLVIAADVDLEAQTFANNVGTALYFAGIKIFFADRSPSNLSSGNMLVDPLAFHNPNGEPTNGEPIRSVFESAGIPLPGLLGRTPNDLAKYQGLPIVIIGARFPIAPKASDFGTMVEEMEMP
jgi:hypothetical protein